MSRPIKREIIEGMAGWDSAVDENFDKLFNSPLPIYQVALITDLPAAAEYDDCLAIVGTGTTAALYISDGTDWVLKYKQSTTVDATASTNLTVLKNKFNELLAALKASGGMAADA